MKMFREEIINTTLHNILTSFNGRNGPLNLDLSFIEKSTALSEKTDFFIPTIKYYNTIVEVM